jgi:hypothetical protein
MVIAGLDIQHNLAAPASNLILDKHAELSKFIIHYQASGYK